MGEVRKEAAWIVGNIAAGGTAANVQSIVNAGAIKGLCDLLTTQDSKIIMVVLDGLGGILKHTTPQKDGDSMEEGAYYARMIEECDGISKIEALQEHENEE